MSHPTRGRRAPQLTLLIAVLLVALVITIAVLAGNGLLPGDPNARGVPSGKGQAAQATLASLLVDMPPRDVPPYDRSQWRLWTDADGDCQNTRQEVLIAESVVPVWFTNSQQCTVAGGRWIDPYSGTVVTTPSALDIDHMVPLANAYYSGAWTWGAARREAYANNLAYPDHLIAVTSSANRSKGDKGPDEWRPPRQADWCTYAIDWVTIKATWALSVTTSERAALEDMLAAC